MLPILSAYSENTRKEKYLAIFGEYVETSKAYMKITTKLGLFAVHKIVSENVESI